MVVTAIRPEELEVKLADGRVGVIDRRDLGTTPVPGVGDSVEAAVLLREEAKGRVALSHSWARKFRAWERMESAKAAHEPVKGTVKRPVKGGFVVDVDGLRAFLPSSLVDEHHVDPEKIVGTEVDVQVVDIDQDADRLVVSRRDQLRRERRVREKEALGALAPGQRTSGRVVDLLEFGARVDLGGGVYGLVHRSELSWARVATVSDVVAVGDQVEVVVIEVQRAKRRIALSMRQVAPDPFESVTDGWIGQAEITRVVEYGAFARLESGAEGLIHLSELSEQVGVRPEELVVPGDMVQVKVIEIDRARRRIGLSVTQALLS